MSDPYTALKDDYDRAWGACTSAREEADNLRRERDELLEGYRELRAAVSAYVAQQDAYALERSERVLAKWGGR